MPVKCASTVVPEWIFRTALRELVVDPHEREAVLAVRFLEELDGDDQLLGRS